MKKQAIIFDCDGVLLDSNRMKSSAFEQTLSKYPKSVIDEFITYQKQNFGRSRYALFDDFFKIFYRQKPEDKEIEQLLNSFGEECRKQYLSVNETIGMRECLESLQRNFTLYVASGSKQDELREVLQRRKLDHYFEGIFGSPDPKTAIVANIKNQIKCAMMIGDAKSDLIAASESSIPFVFMSDYAADQDAMMRMSAEQNFPAIRNLTELIEFIKVNLTEIMNDAR